MSRQKYTTLRTATQSKLQIVSIASEVASFSKTGGLADVARSLPRALQQLGHAVIVITPLYAHISPSEHRLTKIISHARVIIDSQTTIYVTVWSGTLDDHIPIYFIDYPRYFQRLKRIYGYPYDNLRFYVFSVAALKLLALLKIKPDIIQCHDWHTGLIPWLVKHRFTHTLKGATTVFTIHNLTFQLGTRWWRIPAKKRDKGVGALPLWNSHKWKYLNFAKRAVLHADIMNTVSEQYAEDILTPELGNDLQQLLKKRRERLFGIVNGIDYHEYNPKTDPGLTVNYDVRSLQLKQQNKAALQQLFHLPQKPTIPLIGIVSRLSEQKGFDLLMDIFEPLMRMRIQLVVMGAGDPKYEQFFRMLARKYSLKVGVYLEFNEVDATKVYAGSDMFLMPSRFEPCGLGQLISLRYGSIPIVHAVGGIAGTIVDFNSRTKKGNGFAFHSYDSRDLLVAIARATEVYKTQEVWNALMRSGMQESFSWAIPAQKYVQLFRRAIKHQKTTGLAR